MNESTRPATTFERSGDQGISITREFDAPVDRVFRAMHEPDLVAQWIGPSRLTTVEMTQENHHGGTWTLVQRDDEGNEYPFRGVVHGEPTPELSQRTFEWLPMKGHVSFETLRMTDLGNGRTRVNILSLFTSIEERDGMIDSGMREGVGDGYQRLDELLASTD